MRIFINSGHCIGIDSGAVNTTYNVTEAELVLEIGEKVKDILEEKGHEVLLEQSDNIRGEGSYDWFDSVCYHANDYEADCFISLHMNAFNKKANGTEVWYMSGGGSILSDEIQQKLVSALKTKDRGLRYSSSLWTLKYTDMVACLVEIGFIDNDEECFMMMSKKDEIALAIAEGIDNWTKL